MRVLILLVTLLLPGAARALEPVDLALILLSDVSRSVDEAEFRMQKQGYAAALTDPRVVAAVRGGALGAVAIAYVEFAGAGEVRTVLDWRIVRDAGSARALADEVDTAPRSFWGRTSISAGIDHAVHMLAELPFEAGRRVIDVAGDGTNNSGRDVTTARDEAVAAGITVNGLAIMSDGVPGWAMSHVQPPGGLTEWYRQNVIGGPGGFVVEVSAFEHFGEAMTRKLINEIAERLPPPTLGPARL